MKMETLEAVTPRELGALLNKRLNKGYSLYDFGKRDDKCYAYILADDTPLPELNDQEFHEREQIRERENSLKKYGLH